MLSSGPSSVSEQNPESESVSAWSSDASIVPEEAAWFLSGRVGFFSLGSIFYMVWLSNLYPTCFPVSAYLLSAVALVFYLRWILALISADIPAVVL